MTVPAQHAAQWRAFLGPPFLKDSNAAFWDWTVLNYGAAYTPVADTTLAVNTLATAGTFQISATNYPATGGVWLGPNAAGESWTYARYSANSSGTLTIDFWETVDGEYNGEHTAGAVVRFWWPLELYVDNAIQFSEQANQQLSAFGWSAKLSGANFPQMALRNTWLVLVQVRKANFSTGAWGSWTNELVGWLKNPAVVDDASLKREWTATIVGLDGMLTDIEVSGLKVGAEELSVDATAIASGTLAKPYKAIYTGAFPGAEPSLAASNVVDGESDTLWISERYIGNRFPVIDPGTIYDGIDNAASPDCHISQVHLGKYPGQGDGYGWIEITFINNVNSPSGSLHCCNHLGTSDTGANSDEDLTLGIPYSGSAVSGDKYVIAEDADLFAAENPDHDATEVFNAREITIGKGYAERYELGFTPPLPTSGSVLIDLNGDADVGIHSQGTAEQARQALGNHAIQNDYRVEGGPLPATPIQIIIQRNDDSGGRVPYSMAGGDYTIDSHTLDQGSPSLIKFADGSTSVLTSKGNDFFKNLRAPEGNWLVMYDQVGVAYRSVVAWGTSQKPGIGDGPVGPSPSPLWLTSTSNQSSLLAVPGAGETMRYDYTPVSPTEAADYWIADFVHYPGYYPADLTGGLPEWVIIQMPSMDLRLSADINSSVQTIAIADAAGIASTDGLNDSGTIQIGTEQITYTGKTTSAITGCTRGANSTTAAEHDEGDPIYVVDGSIATRALPITSFTINAPAGQPFPRDFDLWRSNQIAVRDPDTLYYTDDWTQIGSTVTDNTTSPYTYTFGSPYPRIGYLLIAIYEMGTAAGPLTVPYYCMLSEVTLNVDSSVYDSTNYVASDTIAGAMKRLCDKFGLPDGALRGSDGTQLSVGGANDNTPTVVNYTTATDMLWPVLADLAEFSNVRIVVRRDSKLWIFKDPFWSLTTPDAIPSELGELTRDEIGRIEVIWNYGKTTGQIELPWRSPDDASSGTAYWPATQAALGRKIRMPEQIYADASAAEAGAKRIYFQLSRPYEVVMELVGDGSGYFSGQTYGVQWQLHDEMEALDRTYVITGAHHEIQDNRWTTVLQAVQISGTSTR
jgi:hypothetical protein